MISNFVVYVSKESLIIGLYFNRKKKYHDITYSIETFTKNAILSS